MIAPLASNNAGRVSAATGANPPVPKPKYVSNLVLYLSSDLSSGCTKQNFIVDAGIT